MDDPWPEFSYLEARLAFETGQKLHRGGQIYLVRRVLREAQGGPVLWVTDERTPGDQGLLLFPNGKVEAVHLDRDEG